MLIHCPECSREISDSAASCPNCGYALTDADKAKAQEKAQEKVLAETARSEREARQAAEKAAKAKSNNKIGNIIKIVVGIGGLLFIWRACAGFGGDGKEQEASKCDDTFSAKYMAQHFVEGRLKSPSTAEWCSYARDFTANLESGVWTVTGCVDSQNAFGATVRTRFTVKMTCNPENWTLVSLTTE